MLAGSFGFDGVFFSSSFFTVDGAFRLVFVGVGREIVPIEVPGRALLGALRV